MPNFGDHINNGLENGVPSIDLVGSGGNWENIGSNIANIGYSLIHPFGWYTLPIYAGVGAAAAITLGPKWGVFYGNPPSGYAGAIIQAFFPTMVKRTKINPLDGKPLMKTVEIDGKSMEVPDIETVWTSNGTYIGSFVNLNNYHIDSQGCVTKNGFVYNPDTGDDDLEPQPISSDNSAGDTRINVPKIPNPLGAMNRYLANNFAHYYLGNHWLLARVPSREIGWYTRRGEELIKRQEWGRYIRVTEVDTAFDVTRKEPMLDLSGFPWWAQVTIIYKIRHLDKAWVSIPNSDDLMIRLVRGALTDWWQENAVLVYEGQDLDKKPKKKPKPLPADAFKNITIGAEGNKDLGERFLEHLGRRLDPKPEEKTGVAPVAEQPENEKKHKMTGLCLEIMNKYGREITNIVIERKGLAGDYEKLLTGIKEAELKRRADIIRSQGRKEVMKNVSEGIDYQVTAIKKGEEAGRIAVLAGLFNEKGEEPSNEDKLTTSFLFKEELKKGRSESSSRKTGGNGRKEFHKVEERQRNENK